LILFITMTFISKGLHHRGCFILAEHTVFDSLLSYFTLPLSDLFEVCALLSLITLSVIPVFILGFIVS
jgi:hypothetical protein